METINNAASAASEKVWGDSNTDSAAQSSESGREPVSGETGDTARGEPYDAGNSDSTNTDSTKVDPQNDSSMAGEQKTAENTESGVSSSGTQQAGGPGNRSPA